MAIDFDVQRANMLESQVRTNDVSDLRIIDAIASVKREAFVADEDVKFAYAEVAVKSKSGRNLLKPRDFAKLAQAAQIATGDEVLVIAGSAGYSAQIFALLNANVTVFDNVASNIKGAITGDIKTLKELNNKEFDVIFVDGGVEEVPQQWGKSLKIGGRLCVITLKGDVGSATIFVKNETSLSSRVLFEARPPKLTEFNRAKEFNF